MKSIFKIGIAAAFLLPSSSTVQIGSDTFKEGLRNNIKSSYRGITESTFNSYLNSGKLEPVFTNLPSGQASSGIKYRYSRYQISGTSKKSTAYYLGYSVKHDPSKGNITISFTNFTSSSFSYVTGMGVSTENGVAGIKTGLETEYSQTIGSSNTYAHGYSISLTESNPAGTYYLTAVLTTYEILMIKTDAQTDKFVSGEYITDTSYGFLSMALTTAKPIGLHPVAILC